MNVDRPHQIERIVLTPRPPGEQAAIFRSFVPLTEEEAALLADKNEDERQAWLRANVPTKERLARVLEVENLPGLAYHARRGLYDDFDEGGAELPQIELVKALKKAGRSDLVKPLVYSGAFDATKAESDAWAARQTGETKRILDAMEGKRPEGPADAEAAKR